MSKPPLVIIGYCNPEYVPGVAAKLLDIQSAGKSIGIGIDVFFAKGHYSYLMHLLLSRSSSLLVRINPCSPINVMLPLIFSYKRIRGTYIIAELPTPVRVGIAEVWYSKEISLRLRLAYVSILLLTMPWSLLLSNRILQYSQESKYFSLGIAHKIRLIANGLDFARISPRNISNSLDIGRFTILGVATLGLWHGYDKIILAISRYINCRDSALNCQFPLLRIVGAGPELENLELLVGSLGLHKHVVFYGSKSFSEYSYLYDDSHIALGTLAGYRIGISSSSSLKNREYCAVGIPFISSQIDLDIPSDFQYFLRISNDESPLELEPIIDWYNTLNIDASSPLKMRTEMEQRMDYRAKIKDMVR